MNISIFAVESDALTAAKAVREALRALMPTADPTPSLEDAQRILNDVRDRGHSYLGSVAAPEEAEVRIRALRAAGVVATEGDPEVAAAAHRSRNLRRRVSAPDLNPHAAVVAFLLMVAEGNPATAAAHATTLSRATGAVEPWRSAQQQIVLTFPPVGDALDENKLRL